MKDEKKKAGKNVPGSKIHTKADSPSNSKKTKDT